MDATDGGARSGPGPLTAGESAVVGAVLIGGGSRRMGRDKALLVVDGQPLLARAVTSLVTALRPPAPPVLVVGPHPQLGRTIHADAARTLPHLPAATHWITDLRTDAGPLAGLEAALSMAAGLRPAAAAVLVVGVDHPWLVPEVLTRLVRRLRAAGPTTAGVVLGSAQGPQPLLGAYQPTALATVSALLDAGERRLRSLTDHLDVEVLGPHAWRDLDPLAATAVDVDDPAALDAATAWHTRAVATALRGPAGAAGGDETHGPSTREVLRVRPVGEVPERAPTAGTARTEVEGRTEIVGQEAAVQVHVGGPDDTPAAVVTLLGAPGQEAELALGWLLTEGHVAARDLLAATVDLDRTPRASGHAASVTVRLAAPVARAVWARQQQRRDPGATTAAGVRAGPTGASGRPTPPKAHRGPVAWEHIARLPGELRLAQSGMGASGGVHAAGLFDRGGRMVTLRQAVGRHSAMDALIGAHLRGGVWPDDGLEDLLCAVSSRIGAALVAKAGTARLPVLAGVGPASDLAIDRAERLGITLIGQLRDGAGTVYTHPHRIALSEDAPRRRGG